MIAGKPKFYYIQVSLAPPLASWWTTLAGWSALGSAIGGLSAAVLAVTAFIGGGAALKRWRENLHAQRDLAKEQENAIRLERLARLNGWSPGIVSVYACSRQWPAEYESRKPWCCRIC